MNNQQTRTPLISIVLCTYNGASFLEAQLQSLLQQTYPQLEIIVSDDASTDGTAAILKSYQSNPVFKIFLQPTNLGAIQNVAFALQQASGDFIAFCDQDDVWLPQKIEMLHQHIGEELLVYSDSELVDAGGNTLKKKLSDLRRMYTGSDTRGFVFSNVVWGHTILISRTLVPHLLPIPEGIPHDIWMAFKAASLQRIKYLDQPLTLYRQHGATVTKTIATDHKARTQNKRFQDFLEKLHWIDVVRKNARENEQPFYNQLYQLYESKKQGRFQPALAAFLLRNQKALFRFSRKGNMSQVIDLLKHARGVAP